MNSDEYKKLFEPYQPSEQLEQKIKNKLFNNAHVRPKALYPSLGIALVLLVIVFSLSVAPKFTHPTSLANVTVTPKSTLSLANIKGQKVIPNKIAQSPLADMIGYSTLPSLIKAAGSFYIIKVVDTQEIAATEEDSYPMQKSKVQVLDTILGPTIPKEITITQAYNVDFTSNNLLRKNSIYVVPLSSTDQETEYQINNSFFLLFEVDDQNNVYSHSNFYDFNRLDGKPLSFLVNRIQSLAQNTKDLPVLTSSIERLWAFEKGFSIVTGHICSEPKEKTAYGSVYYSYDFKIDRTIYGANDKKVISITSSKKIPTEMICLVAIDSNINNADTYTSISLIDQNAVIQKFSDEYSYFFDYYGQPLDSLDHSIAVLEQYYQD